MKLLDKIKDFNDEKVAMVILIDDLGQLDVLADEAPSYKS